MAPGPRRDGRGRTLKTLDNAIVLRTASSAPTMPSLSRFIEDVSAVVPTAGRSLEVDQLPDGRTSLVFRVFEEGRQGDVAVVGPRTRAVFKNATGVARAVVVRFKPGWSISLLGITANALTDQIVMLEDIWGRAGAELAAELLTARNLTELIDRLSQAIALRALQTLEPASARLARRAVRLLEGEEVRVANVAKRLGVTSRHLRRAFIEGVGVGPKDFARTVRLQRAIRYAETSSDWGRIAADTGYYDQSHLIADFRQLLGLTPNAFLRRVGDRGVRQMSDVSLAG